MDKLTKAVSAGKRDRSRAKKAAARSLESEKARKQRGFSEEVKRLRAKMLANDYLYREVRAAVARKEDCLILSGSPALEAAIDSIPGFRATYTESWDYLNSDEVKEDLSYVTVRWEIKK